MADLPSVAALIQLEETQFQDSIGEGLFTKLGSAINFLLDNQVTNDVGTIIESVLTESEFQTERDETWVAMDGRDVTGSSLDTLYGISTLPDMRDKFARVMDDGLGTDSGRVVATEQDSQNVTHRHFHLDTSIFGAAPNASTQVSQSPFDSTDPLAEYAGDDAIANTGLSQAVGEADFKPVNTTVGYYIKINL